MFHKLHVYICVRLCFDVKGFTQACVALNTPSPGGGALWVGVAPVGSEASLQEVDLLAGGL